MADTNTLGSMLQGISQQPPHIRQEGQVTEQVNFLSHVTKGITSRPGSHLLATSNIPVIETFKTITVAGEKFQVGFTPKAVPQQGEQKITILDVEGVPQVVTLSQSANDYVGEDMDIYVYDNKDTKTTYVFNREFITAMDADVASQQAEVVRDIGLVTCLGGIFGHTYSVTVEYENGDKLTASYTCPDGTADGDAAKSTSDFIIARIAAGLRGSGSLATDIDQRTDQQLINVFGTAFEFTTLPTDTVQFGDPAVGTEIFTSGSTLLVTGVPNIKISVEDGSGGDTLVTQTNTAKSTEDLADFAPHGTLVRVIGLDGSEDDFWMRYELIEDGGVVGEGFGSEGLWREWYNVDEPSQLDVTTMPHEIIQTSPGVFSVEEAVWANRARGDTETNPDPGFIGQPIRDVNGFQSRMVLISGAVTMMSVTDDPGNFFKKSAVAEVATDPIEMVSTAPGEFSLQYIVPFNRDLLIFGNNNQFLIAGGGGLTAANASMVQTTAFTMADGIRPVHTGRTVLMAFTQGEYSGVKEFYAGEFTEANDATTITELVPKLLLGKITAMIVSTNFDTALIQTDADDNTLYVYKYLWDGRNKVQSAWSVWTFADPVDNFFFLDSSIYVLLFRSSIDSNYQVLLDLDLPDNTQLGYNVALDAVDSYTSETTSVEPSGQEYTEFLLPFDNMVVIQGVGCLNTGQTVSTLRTEPFGSSYRYYLPTSSVPTGATVWAGVDFTSTLKPTMPFIRGGDNKVMRFVRLVLSRFIIHFDRSGPITATRSSRYRSEDVSVSNDYAVLDLDPDDPDKNNVSTGYFNVPFREQSDISELTITASGGLPVTINEIEWVGQSRGGRRRR